MIFALLLIAVIFLACANGANDNFKGVATLYGSGTTSYRGALGWATVTTLLGSITAVVLAGQLLKNFSGRGLVDDTLVSSPIYVAAVAWGSALTVLLATRIGMPISTTHSLVGALVGAGWSAGSSISMTQLVKNFFGPLLLSPVLAIAATAAVYLMFHGLRRWVGITSQTCVCVGSESLETVPAAWGPSVTLPGASGLSARVAEVAECQRHYQGAVWGIDVATAVDRLHFVSAGIVSFARGLNDTPKIAALLLLAPFLGQVGTVSLVGLAIAIGGVLGARRVAELLSQKITTMNPGQAFAANLVTGAVVIGASQYGLPVSTTHVSCGALFGIGTVSGQAQWRTIAKVLSAWMTTLPAGALFGAAAYACLRGW